MSVTLKIPYDRKVMLAASEFFAKLAEIGVEQAAVDAIPVSPEGIVIGNGPDAAIHITATATGTAATPSDIEVSVAPGATVTLGTTPTTPTGDASVPSAEPEPPVSHPVNPVPPAPVIPAPPVAPTAEVPVGPTPPDAAAVFGGASLPQDSPVPPPASNGVELDSRGLPWDGRIHASSRAKIADGSWRNRKCPAEYQKPQWDEFIARTEDELRNAMAIPGPLVPPAAPTTYSEKVNQNLQEMGSNVPPPVVPPPSAPAAPSAITTFAALNVAITSNAIQTAAVTAAVQAVGLQAYPLLAARPDLIPAVAAILFPGQVVSA